MMLDDKTAMFELDNGRPDNTREIMTIVYSALKDKGYNPISQIVGYFLSGDPAYITSHKNARELIRKLEIDEILEKMIQSYLSNTNDKK